MARQNVFSNHELSINQHAESEKLAEGLADLHRRSTSPTAKFGFYVATCHAKIPQAVDRWSDSWCAVFTAHLARIANVASPILQWPEFDVVARLALDAVVPRLLLPLQSDGRVLKPCLVHGDCWMAIWPSTLARAMPSSLMSALSMGTMSMIQGIGGLRGIG